MRCCVLWHSSYRFWAAGLAPRNKGVQLGLEAGGGPTRVFSRPARSVGR